MQVCTLTHLRQEIKSCRYVYVWAEFGVSLHTETGGTVGVWGYVGKAQFRSLLADYPPTTMTSIRRDTENNDLYVRLPLDAIGSIA